MQMQHIIALWFECVFSRTFYHSTIFSWSGSYRAVLRHFSATWALSVTLLLYTGLGLAQRAALHVRDASGGVVAEEKITVMHHI